MAHLALRLNELDYSRASAFVVARLRRLGAAPTSIKPLSLLAAILYVVPLFVIVVAPNSQDEITRWLLRGSVLALLVVPALFVFGVSRLRKADTRALSGLAPAIEETVHFEAIATHLALKTDTMSATFPWSAVSLFVIDPDFAVLLAPRTAPTPLTREGSASEQEFYTFLRHAQQYKAAASEA